MTKMESIITYLRDAIISGELEDGTVINVHDLAEKFDCHQRTIERALRSLKGNKMICSNPRIGYVVGEKIPLHVFKEKKNSGYWRSEHRM